MPVFVLVDATAGRILLLHVADASTTPNGGLVSADAKGNLIGSTSASPGGELLWEGGVFMDGGSVTYDFDSTTIEVLGIAESGHSWAKRYVDQTLTMVRQAPDTRTPHIGTIRGGLEVSVHIAASHQVEIPKNAMGSPPFARQIASDWMEGAEGGGAIAEDGSIVTVTTEGMLIGYSGRGVDDQPAERTFERRIGYRPYDISFAGNEIAILEARGGGDVRKAYRWEDDLAHAFPSLGVRWSTRLHRLNRHGHETAHVDVPFEALMPPILAGNGRAYLAGMGLAAIDGGAIAWMERSKSIIRATAFEGGELAITTGNGLHIVGRDGVVRQSFAVKGEIIGTPPAIGPDGAIWFATDKALYMAR